MDNFEFDSSLIEPIINFLDIGIDKFLPAVLVFAALMGVIDLLWGYFQYHTTKDVSNIISKVAVKLIRYAFTFGIIKIYTKTIIPMAYKIFTGIGNSFGEGFGDPLKIQNVWNKGWESVNRLFELSGKVGGLWGFVYIIFSVIAFLCLVFILSAMTMAILSFHVVVRLAVIFLALVPFEALADIGRKTLTSIVNSGIDLMTCIALSSMCFSVMQKHPFPKTVTEDTNSPQVIGIWLCVWVVSGFLVVSYEKISSLIISGQGGLTGADLGYAILVREEFSCLEFIMNRDTINWILKKLNTGGRIWSIYQRKSIKTASATRWWETTTSPIWSCRRKAAPLGGGAGCTRRFCKNTGPASTMHCFCRKNSGHILMT